jgi:hypothetical protein
MALSGRSVDAEGYRAEFIRLVDASRLLAQQQGARDADADDPRPLPYPVLR